MPQRESERLADRMLAAWRPILVQLLDLMPPDEGQTDESGLTEADHARIDCSVAKLRQRQRSAMNERRKPTPKNTKRPTGKVERSQGSKTA